MYLFTTISDQIWFGMEIYQLFQITCSSHLNKLRETITLWKMNISPLYIFDILIERSNYDLIFYIVYVCNLHPVKRLSVCKENPNIYSTVQSEHWWTGGIFAQNMNFIYYTDLLFNWTMLISKRFAFLRHQNNIIRFELYKAAFRVLVDCYATAGSFLTRSMSSWLAARSREWYIFVIYKTNPNTDPLRLCNHIRFLLFNWHNESFPSHFRQMNSRKLYKNFEIRE